MKTIKIMLLAMSLGLMSFSVQTTITDPIVKGKTTSPVSWKAETIDLGEIPQGTPKDIVYEFKNTGKTDIVIINVKPSCGCTAADYTKTPIAPGKTGTINAKYNAAAKGAFTKTITVTTSAEEAPKMLTFKGTVI